MRGSDLMRRMRQKFSFGFRSRVASPFRQLTPQKHLVTSAFTWGCGDPLRARGSYIRPDAPNRMRG
eukprot:7010165-Prymnesium_polylepis.1